ncbi:HAD family hydrolase [Desulfobulbus sp. F5]|nr:HAD family hydrolase [Desulfobulbus sp. F5]
MLIKGLIFDINGTLTDINTDEGNKDLWRTLSNLLLYQGISLAADELRELYFTMLKAQRAAGGEQHPEFDAVAIFQEIIRLCSTAFTQRLPAAKLEQLPLFLAETLRAASLFQLKRYRGVRDTIKQLHQQYRLAAVSDGQTPYALPELNAVGLMEYFNPIIVSGDFGYRKPDRRLFEKALYAMELKPDEVLFIGNDMYRDVFGAKQFGIKTVFFKSNQGQQDNAGAEADYIIYNFPELLNAVQFFTQRF